MESYITPPEHISYIFNGKNYSASETAENNSNLMSSSSNMAVPASQKLGRPKGSTIKCKYDLKKEICKQRIMLQSNSKAEGQCKMEEEEREKRSI